jgi:hypothetical protein
VSTTSAPTKRSSDRFVSGRRGWPRLRLIIAAAAIAGVLLGLVLVLPGRGAGHPVAAVLRLPKGHPVLLSFLDTQAQPSASGNASRSQLVFLKSMDTQSRAAGLRTVVVDAAHTLGKRPPTASDLVNLRYDWALSSTIAVVGDPRGDIARTYHVVGVPTTLLLDAHGALVDRWTGFVGAAPLDFAVRRVTGRHGFG